MEKEIRPKKIAIIGSHSTGKTTLAEAVSEQYSVPYVRGDKTQDIFKRLNFKNGIDRLNLDEQWTLQQEILSSIEQSQTETDRFVTDGCTLTCIPYGLLYSDHKIADQPGFRDFVNRIHESARKLDLIVYLPPEIGLEDDNFRPLDEQMRFEIDSMLQEVLAGYDYRTVAGSIVRRVEDVGKLIGRVEKTVWDNYIALEGLPRSGKSTHIKILEDMANRNGIPIHRCRRMDSKYMRDFKRLRTEDPYSCSDELIELNCAAINYDFVNNNVEERLEEGQIVLGDRHKFTLLSMFASLGAPEHKVYSRSVNTPNPGRVLYLDINPEISVLRAIETKQGPLKKDIDYQRKVASFYNKISRQYGFERIDANRSLNKVSKDIVRKVLGDDTRGKEE